MNKYDPWDGAVVNEHNEEVLSPGRVGKGLHHQHQSVVAWPVRLIAVQVGRNALTLTESDARVLIAQLVDALAER